MDRSKWEYKKLGEVCAPKSDILRANKLFGNDDIIDYVDISSIDNTTHSITQPTSYVFKEAPSRAQQKVEQGDILYSLVRPNLKNIAVVTSSDTDKYVASSGFCVLRGKDVETRYLYHLVLGDAFTNYILGLVSGANYPAVREDDVKGFSFRCPPVADQQRIVAELDCLNEMIALKQEQLKEFDKLAQSIFYDMFGEGYNTKFLWEFCEVGTGATPDRKKVAIYYGGNVNWVKTTEVHNCDIYETEERITDIALEQTNCKVYYPGAILMAMYGQGKTRGQVARLMTKAATNQACAAIIPDTRICDKDYLYIYLLLSYEKIRNMARGGNQANLNLSLVKMIPIPLPPLALQQQFAEKIQAIEAQKELVKKSIAETQQLLDSRMDYYFD